MSQVLPKSGDERAQERTEPHPTPRCKPVAAKAALSQQIPPEGHTQSGALHRPQLLVMRSQPCVRAMFTRRLGPAGIHTRARAARRKQGARLIATEGSLKGSPPTVSPACDSAAAQPGLKRRAKSNSSSVARSTKTASGNTRRRRESRERGRRVAARICLFGDAPTLPPRLALRDVRTSR